MKPDVLIVTEDQLGLVSREDYERVLCQWRAFIETRRLKIVTTGQTKYGIAFEMKWVPKEENDE